VENEHRVAEVGGLVRGVWHRKVLVGMCALVAGGSALGFSLLQEQQYTAKASLLFRDPGFDQRLFGAPAIPAAPDADRQAATNVRLVSLDVVADRTAEDLGTGLDGDDVSDQLDIEEEGQSNVISIAATDPDPEFAARLANTFAENYIEFRRGADRAKVADAIRLVEDEYSQLGPDDQEGNRGDALQREISELETLKALQTGNAELVQTADVPDEASSPKIARNTVLGGILGLLLGVGLALLFERVDRRVREPAELEELLELPVLGAVPASAFLAEAPEQTERPLPFSEAEAFRMLRTRLRYFNVDRDIRSVVVTSAVPSEGKSTVAWNLAMTAAGAGTRVVLIEADLHHPTFAETVGIAPLPGLAEILTKQSSYDGAVQEVVVPGRVNGGPAGRRLHVLVAGTRPPNPAELLESEEMASLVRDASRDYDLVVLDTPPVNVLADAIPLMRKASGVIVVSAIGQSTRDDVTSLRQQIDKLGIPALGAVANKVEAKGGRYGYYYGRYGGENGAATANETRAAERTGSV
jgi:capsular exopolysaccharide synthesis family protein